MIKALELIQKHNFGYLVDKFSLESYKEVDTSQNLNNFPRERLLVVTTPTFVLKDVTLMGGTLLFGLFESVYVISGMDSDGNKISNRVYHLTSNSKIEGKLLEVSSIRYKGKSLSQMELVLTGEEKFSITLVTVTKVFVYIERNKYELSYSPLEGHLDVKKYGKKNKLVERKIYKNLNENKKFSYYCINNTAHLSIELGS